ncbi:hypothetical protein H1R20_g377, partial [Candolleomyces eurysporus]
MDRLAAARQQRQQQSGIEMNRLPPNNPPGLGEASGGARSAAPTFLAEVASIEQDIQQLNQNVASISATRSHYLTSIDGTEAEDNDKLENLTVETRQLTQRIKSRIQELEGQPQYDTQIRKNQSYQREEHESDQKARQQISKQLHLVKPDATPEDVKAFIDSGQQQVFAQALTTSTRYGESRTAYREVQERQQDIHRMEKTLAELAQLFNDMAVLVEEQEAVITAVENTAVDIEGNTKVALDNTKEAVISAKRYRRGRWICFGIFVVICSPPTMTKGNSSSRRRRASLDLVDAKQAVDLATAQTYSENVFLFVPNLIGYARVILAGLALHYMSYHPKYCTLAYGISCLLDAVDGHAARALGQTSKFGAVLDMVTDRCTTSCLLCYLASAYPPYAILFQFLIALDFSSHYMHMYSHKLVTSDVSRILWLYYNDSRTLFFFCAGNELFFVALYLMKWTSGSLGLSGALSTVTWPQAIAILTFPIFLGKNIINVVQLWKASKILVGVDLAEREQARLAAKTS